MKPTSDTLSGSDSRYAPLVAPDGLRHLFVSDMDGTLLDDTGHVSPESARILSWLCRRGVMFTVATARTPATVGPLLAHTYTFLPAIVMTGAATWDRACGCYGSCHIMSRDLAETVLSTCLSRGIHPFMYRFDTPASSGSDRPGSEQLLRVYHSPLMTRKEQDFIDERRHLPLKRFHIVDDADSRAMPTDNVVLFFTIGDKKSVYEAADILATRTACTVSSYPDIFNRNVAIMEVFAPGVSKGEAVKALARKCGADRITVFGDNLNDLAMMDDADTSVAVANAQPAVLRAAGQTIGPNTADSVARYILKFYTGLDSLL